MDIREKLVELLLDIPFGNSTEEAEQAHAENVAEYLIDNGVTVQGDKDINVPTKWISVKDRLPTEEDAKIMGEYLPAIQKGQKPNVWKWTEVAKYPQYFTHWYALPQPPKGE